MIELIEYGCVFQQLHKYLYICYQMERAHGMTVDFKQRFRKKQSKSVEGGKSTENLETEFRYSLGKYNFL